jgi:ABC-type Fe3+-hydroxamate transport system substrate-binding protein
MINKKMIVAILVLSFLVVSIPISSLDSSADTSTSSSFTVTDGNGNTFTFDGAVDHVVIFGYAATLTVAETGNISKIIACDMYSQYSYYSDSRLATLNAYNLGSPYTSDFSSVETWLLQAVEDGSFDKEKDAVILTSSTNANTILRADLISYGFKNVLFWGTPTNYSDLVNCVSSVAKIAGGVDNTVSSQVQSIYDNVTAEVSGRDKQDYVYLYYSSTSGVGIGTDSCLGSSMINAAGGNNILPDDVTATSGGIYYGGTSYLIQLLENNPDTVIFIASNFKMTAEEFATTYLGGSDAFNIVVMGNNWNNYCLDSVLGLQTVSDYFADMQKTSGTSDSNDYSVMYIVAAAIIVLIIVGAAVYVTKKHSK